MISGRTEKTLKTLALAVIALGLLVRVLAFLYNRSLWFDEAMLASSLVQRGFGELLLPLDYNQGAPIGYLWIVKAVVFLLGPSELALRLPSLVAGLLSVGLFYRILRDVFHDPRPWAGTAFFATIPFLIEYSIELKPYMFDGMMTLLILWLFHLTRRGKLPPWLWVVFTMAAVWISFPVIFVLAGGCLLWVGWTLHVKNRRETILAFITGTAVLMSFTAFFFVYYGNLEGNQSNPFWDLVRFPLIPRSGEDLQLMFRMLRHYLSVFRWHAFIPVAALSIYGLSLLRRDFPAGALLALVLLTGALVLTTSWLGFFGIVDRVMLFFIPLHVLLVSLAMADVGQRWRKAGLLLAFLMAMINLASARYLLPSQVCRPTYEVNPLIARWQSLEEPLPVYVYNRSIPQFVYKTGYVHGLMDGLQSPASRERVIYGTPYYESYFESPYERKTRIKPDLLAQNVAAIEAHDKVCLLMGLCRPKDIRALVQALEASGTVTEMLNVCDTPLYLYEKHSEK